MDRSITVDDLRDCLPDVESTLRLPGLDGSVTVYRDAWGIPHIRAESQSDLFFAQGLATAQDRLWHMDADRHQALGRWSELVGPGGVARDRLLRAAGMGRTAKLDYAACSDQARSMIDAYAAGVNAFLSTTQSLPIEYRLLETEPEPWESWHCLAVYKMRNTLLGTFEPKLFHTRLAQQIGPVPLARIIRGYPSGHLLTVPPGAEYDGPSLDGGPHLGHVAEEAEWMETEDWPSEEEPGSNGWSISGDLTASGLPLVAGDSHRSLDAPNVYYQVHLSCPDFTVIGSSVPGMPGALHFCHNEHVAWGMTYGMADTQDLFIERFRHGARGLEYEFRGKWLPAEVLAESIQVRGGEGLQLQVVITHHGPVIAGDPERGWGIAIGDPGLLGATKWPDAALEAMQARSVEGLHDAFGEWTDRVNNYAVADVAGDFGYLHEGRIPIRGEANGWRAVPGWTGEHEWQGYIPHEELPRAINPEVGYAVTCNQRVAGYEYPYYVGLRFAAEHRARRVQARVLALGRGQATVEDMAAIHAERVSIPAQVLVRSLDGVEPPDEVCARALEVLRRWDGAMDRGQVGPTVYTALRCALLRRLVRHLLGAGSERVLTSETGSSALVGMLALEVHLALERGSTDLLPAGEDWPSMLSGALREAVAVLTRTLGEDSSTWLWGSVHRTGATHPLSAVFPECAELLDPPSLAVHGDGDTPLAGSFGVADPAGGPFAATAASVTRYVHDPSDWARSLWIVPLGASGHPGSPHYADQAELWAEVSYIPQLWWWDQIAAEAETAQQLVPVSI